MALSNFLKNFIEDNIELIENKDWDNLIIQWSKEADEAVVYKDSWFVDLKQVITSLGYDVLKETTVVRRKLMIEEIRISIDHLNNINLLLDAHNINKVEVIKCLPNIWLGFSLDDLYDLVDYVAKTYFNATVHEHFIYIP